MPTETFEYTGSVQTFSLDNKLSPITVRMYGAGGQGGDGDPDSSFIGPSSGGTGGYTEVELDVSSFSSLDVFVGGGNGNRWGRSNGGGGGSSDAYDGNPHGGNGGGSTELLGSDSTFLAAADAGGGGARGGSGGSGSAYGGDNGGDAQGTGNGGNGGHGDYNSPGDNGNPGGGEVNSTYIPDGGTETITTGGGNDGNAVVEIEYTELNPPENVAATAGNEDEITLTWDQSTGAEEIRIYRGTSSGVSIDQTPHATTAGTATSYTDTGLSDGEQYFYVLTSYASGTETSGSSEVSETTILPAPTDLTVDAVRAVEVDLSWTDNHDYGDTRVEYKQSDASSWTTFSTLSRNANAVTITGLLHGEQYDTRVIAQTEHTETVDQ